MVKAVYHDHSAWLKSYGPADKETKKHMRSSVSKQTIGAIQNGYKVKKDTYEISSSDKKAMRKGTLVIHKPKDVSSAPTLKHKEKTKVMVVDDDTISAALKLKKEGLNPVALNHANARDPGGSWIGGSASQEEDCVRRSNYSDSLDPRFNKHIKKQFKDGKYKVPREGVIYSPGVTVFRKSTKDGYKFTKPSKVTFLASAACDLKKDKPKDYENVTDEKIRGVFRTIIGMGHDSAVLGAYGCGSYKNNPEKIAKKFSKIMSEDEFRNKIKVVVFAIPNDHSKHGNYATFEKEFS